MSDTFDLTKTVVTLARNARELVPDAATVRLESSDQGAYLTASTVAIVGADGREHESAYGRDAENLTDTHPLDPDTVWDLLDVPASAISYGMADNAEAPGWVAVNKRGGYYEIDVPAALAAAQADAETPRQRYSVTLTFAADNEDQAGALVESLRDAIETWDGLPVVHDLTVSEITTT